MSNGSSHRAVRPFVNGQQQEDNAQNRQESFFRDAAAWIMKAIDGKPTGKPPSIPDSIPDESWDYWVDNCRPSLHRLFQRLHGTFEGSSEDIRDDKLDVLHDCLLIWQFTDVAFELMLSELMKNGFADRTIANMIESEADPSDDAHGDRDFDGVHAQYRAEIAEYRAEIAEARKPKEPAAEVVADMAEEKSARTKDKPAKAVDTFAKMFDWIGKLKIPASRRLLLAELVRAGRHDCPVMTWVGNSSLAESTGVLRRQVQRTLKLLESAGHITIRNYRSDWCKTQRVIFVNRLAERAGVDPKSVNLPPGRTEFFTLRASIGKRLESGKKPAKSATVVTTNPIGCHTGHPIGESGDTIGCPVRHLGGVLHDTRRDKGFSAPKGAEKTHTVVTVSTSPPKGVLPLPTVEERPKPKPALMAECDLVPNRSTARPAHDWPATNLPATNQEPALAKKVRLRQVTHVHPKWLNGLSCWVARLRSEGDDGSVLMPPKTTHDGWFEITGDTLVVPLIDSENRRVPQDEFAKLLAVGRMKPSDPSKPVIERTSPPGAG